MKILYVAKTWRENTMLRYGTRFAFLTAASIALTATSANAAVTAVTLTNPPSLNLIDTISADGTTYNASDLVLGEVTDLTTDAEVIVQGSVPADVSSVLDSDLNVQNGFANPSSLSFMFSTPIENISGVDFYIVDFGNNNDAHDITINGQTQSYAQSSFDLVVTGPLAAGFASKIFDAMRTSTDPDDLDGLNWTQNNNLVIDRTIKGYDLSDFGVAAGGSASSLRIDASDFDPMAIGGFVAIPEPGSVVLMSLGLGAMATRRTRRQ